MQENSATVHYSGVPSLRRAFTTQMQNAQCKMHYAQNECAMPIRLHCNELRALCPTTNVLCRTAEFGALLLKCVLIVSIWSEKGVFAKNHRRYKDEKSLHLFAMRIGISSIEFDIKPLIYYGFQTPWGPVFFLAITSSGLARSLSNYRTLHFSPSANFCQYGLLTKNR